MCRASKIFGGTFAGGTVTVSDIDSVLGRLSLRVGTTIQTPTVVWQPYFTASVFHEFAGDVTSSSLAAVNVLAGGGLNNGVNGFILVTKSEGGVGTYAQFALGTAAVLGNSGWLSYVRGDYRIGENIEGWGITPGCAINLVLSVAVAKGRSVALYAYNWTGPYIGAFLGTTWGSQNQWTFDNGTGSMVKPDVAGRPVVVRWVIIFSSKNRRWY